MHAAPAVQRPTAARVPPRRALRIEVANASTTAQDLYYQVDYTVEAEVAQEHGYLHVDFRREN